MAESAEAAQHFEVYFLWKYLYHTYTTVNDMVMCLLSSADKPL